MARLNNDQAHLCRLREAYAQMGCLPSYKQIANILNFKAKNAAFKLSQRLIATGHLVKTVGGRLAPGPAFFNYELNSDAAESDFVNAPSLVQPKTLNHLLNKSPSKTAFISVKDSSLKGDGILKGDIAIVDIGSQANNGDLIIAEIDGTRIFKELRHDEKRLEAITQSLSCIPIAPEKTINIIGVVRGIIRSYRPSTTPPFMMKG